MRRIGFSTGALALSDFERGIRLQQDAGLNAVEVSALRENELDPLIEALPGLSLGGLDYVSFHAPSRLKRLSETDLVNRLQIIRDIGWPIIIHPDVISDTRAWTRFGGSLLLENLDQRKPVARTVAEMGQFFDLLPDARFCFDIAHARQVDPTMSVAVELLFEFGDRLAEIHISEVDSDCRHIAMSSAAVNAYQRVASLIPSDTPAIIESMISSDRIRHEVELTRCCFDTTSIGSPISV